MPATRPNRAGAGQRLLDTATGNNILISFRDLTPEVLARGLRHLDARVMSVSAADARVM